MESFLDQKMIEVSENNQDLLLVFGSNPQTLRSFLFVSLTFCIEKLLEAFLPSLSLVFSLQVASFVFPYQLSQVVVAVQ